MLDYSSPPKPAEVEQFHARLAAIRDAAMIPGPSAAAHALGLPALPAAPPSSCAPADRPARLESAARLVGESAGALSAAAVAAHLAEFAKRVRAAAEVLVSDYETAIKQRFGEIEQYTKAGFRCDAVIVVADLKAAGALSAVEVAGRGLVALAVLHRLPAGHPLRRHGAEALAYAEPAFALGPADRFGLPSAPYYRTADVLTLTAAIRSEWTAHWADVREEQRRRDQVESVGQQRRAKLRDLADLRQRLNALEFETATGQ